MKKLMKSLAVAVMSPLAAAALSLVLSPSAAGAIELTCGAPVIYRGEQSKDSHDTVVGVDVYYSNGEWRVRHHMGNGSEIHRINQYSIRDTSSRSATQWRGESYKYPGILWMTGEIQRDKRTGQPVYIEWIHNRGRLVMNTAAFCREQVAQQRPNPTPLVSAPPPVQAPLPPVVQAPPQAPQPTIIVVPQPVPQVVNPPPAQVVSPPPPAAPPGLTKVEEPAKPKRDAIPISAQNGRVMVNVGLGDRTLTMLLDTGADSLVITGSTADGLVRDGHARWAGMDSFSMADGTVRDIQTVTVFEVKVGNHVVRNVKAGVLATGTHMLLGMSVLQAIGPFLLDTRNQQLVFMPAEASL